MSIFSADSPNISLDTVGTNTTGQSSMPIPQQWVDSDDEADLEVDWSSNVAPDILQSLSEAEKKRQEIINGKLIYTFVSIRSLLIIYVTFYFRNLSNGT